MRRLANKLKHLPDRPGIYIFKDGAGSIIYVGKAKSLRKRVSSYFRRSGPGSIKTSLMVDSVRDLEYIVTGSELEAVMLESNFIKKHRPRYNIILKDDKQYPYIKLTVQEEWPRVMLTRKIENDGAKYFGPYGGGTVRETLRLIGRLFRIRWCKETPLKKRKRPCMYYHIKRCSGPCTGRVSRNEYLSMCGEVAALLEGRYDSALDSMRAEMKLASGRLDFELARAIRDRVRIVERMADRQSVVGPDLADRDIVSIFRRGNGACSVVFQVRRGKLVKRDVFYPQVRNESSDAEIMSAVLRQYYADMPELPPEVALGVKPEAPSEISRFLSSRRGRKVKLTVPGRGAKKKLVEMADENARLLLERKVLSSENRAASAMSELRRRLKLSSLPIRIEAFDVSNIQGSHTVGSMVAFVEGEPLKRDYRKFKVRSVEGADDVASMFEIVKRRYSGSLKNSMRQPDLVLVDGGRGQVSAARRAMNESGMKQTPVIGLAKKREEIHILEKKSPIRLPRRSQALKLLQRLRDEAHRFAVKYHRRKRGMYVRIKNNKNRGES